MTFVKMFEAQNLPKLRPLYVFFAFVIGVVFLPSLLTPSCIASPTSPPNPVFGDYDAEPRIADHVDTDFLVRRLNELHANTYMWLIRHNTNDWNDLKVFLPKARKAGITVWVYLVPHTETAAQDGRSAYSEPFRLDYVRWAEEIAKLSLQNTNLTGYVIDDFWSNVCPGRFSRDYIRRMVTAGKTINPKLKFYPLMYFSEINYHSVDLLSPLIDGMVAAYPPDLSSVEHALIFLQDRYRLPGSATIVYPWEIPSRPGNHAFIVQKAEVEDPAHAQLSFRYRDDFEGPTAGYHQLQLRVDDRIVWAEDVEGHDDGVATINLAKVLGGKKMVKLSLGVSDEKGVSDFGILASFSDLTVRGLKPRAVDLEHETAWSKDITGDFSVEFIKKPTVRRFRLPLIVMPAGEAWEYSHRYPGEAPNPENIALRIKELVEFAKQKQIEGVVTYCLDKQDGSRIFEAVRKVFKAAQE